MVVPAKSAVPTYVPKKPARSPSTRSHARSNERTIAAGKNRPMSPRVVRADPGGAGVSAGAPIKEVPRDKPAGQESRQANEEGATCLIDRPMNRLSPGDRAQQTRDERFGANGTSIFGTRHTRDFDRCE